MERKIEKFYTFIKEDITQQDDFKSIDHNYWDEDDNYQSALDAFEYSEGRKPNMNNIKDSNAVSAIQLGIEYARNHNNVLKSDLLRKIKDRIINNVSIIEYNDDRDPELNVDDCMKVIKDDIKDYTILKKY